MSEKHERIYAKDEERVSTFTRAVTVLMVATKIQNRTADDDWVRSELAESGDEEFRAPAKIVARSGI